MLLLKLFGKVLSPCSKICNRASFARFAYPYGRTRAHIPVRRSVLQVLLNSKTDLKLPGMRTASGKSISLIVEPKFGMILICKQSSPLFYVLNRGCKLRPGSQTSGVTEAVGALRDFSARGPQLRPYVKWYDRHGKRNFRLMIVVCCLSQQHGKEESMWAWE